MLISFGLGQREKKKNFTLKSEKKKNVEKKLLKLRENFTEKVIELFTKKVLTN